MFERILQPKFATPDAQGDSLSSFIRPDIVEKANKLAEQSRQKVRLYGKPLYHNSRSQSELVQINEFRRDRDVYFTDVPVQGTNIIVTLDEQLPLILADATENKQILIGQAVQTNIWIHDRLQQLGFDGIISQGSSGFLNYVTPQGELKYANEIAVFPPAIPQLDRKIELYSDMTQVAENITEQLN